MKIIFTIIALLFVNFSHAQKLNGTWQGKMDEYEFLQLNIIQIGNNLCGYSFDYDLRDKKSFCKAYFSGSYNKVLNAWFIEGSSFMEQGGGHVLMQLKFKIAYEGGKTVLNGICRIKPTMFFTDNNPSTFMLNQTSTRPTIITETMKECMETYNSPARPQPKITPLPKTIKPIENKPAENSLPKLTPAPKKDTPVLKNQNEIMKTKPLLPVEKTPVIKDTVVAKTIIKANTLPATTNGRIDKELRRIVVHDKKIKLNIYDNGTIDGDTISIYYNGRAILKNKGLTANALIVEVELDENIAMHSIVLYAENLGSIAPNTALVIFTTSDGKRYELYSSATLQQNAAIVFEYKPK